MLETIDFITQTLLEQKGKLDRFDPPVVYESTRWQQWVTQPSPGTCPYCMLQDGRIYSRAEQPSIPPPVHPNCKCRLTPLREIPAGMATDKGLMGADFWLKMSRTLPEYYISEEEIRALGWQRGKSPARYAPGKMLTKGEYENRNGHLPQRDGRVWYEADLNYHEGKRNRHRIVWSNDGLIFVTYDHYATFYAIE
mgnify:FL=1